MLINEKLGGQKILNQVLQLNKVEKSVIKWEIRSWIVTYYLQKVCIK